MTVDTDTAKSSRESPSKSKRKRSRSSSTDSSSSDSSTSTSSSSRSSSSSSSGSSSSSSRSSSPASSPEKRVDRAANKSSTKSSTKKSNDHSTHDEKGNGISTADRSPSPSRREEKEKPSTKIYIGKLSLNVTKEHLAEIFGTFGEIKEIDLPLHRIHPNLHRGVAYIEYLSASSAEQACKYMEGGQIDGQEIACNLVPTQPAYGSNDRNRRETSPYRPRRRSPYASARRYPPPGRRIDDRDRDRGRYNDRRRDYSPPSRNYRRGASPTSSSRRTGTGGANAAESPKKKERRYSRSSSSESK